MNSFTANYKQTGNFQAHGLVKISLFKLSIYFITTEKNSFKLQLCMEKFSMKRLHLNQAKQQKHYASVTQAFVHVLHTILTKPSQCSIYTVWSICGSHDYNMCPLFKTIHECEQLRNNTSLHFSMRLQYKLFI